MRWSGRRESSNVEDRRGQGGFGGGFGRGRMPINFPTGGGPVRRGGGIGIVGLLVIIGIMWLLGVNPIELLSGMQGGGGPVIIGSDDRPTTAPAPGGSAGAPSDQGGKFVATVLADTEDTWNRIFARANRTYREPTLVLFSGQTQSACGFASAAMGPFYCPGDQKLYIDLRFYDQLRNQFGADGDFAEAYVIAHEVGHHVQNLLGILPKVDAARRQTSQAQANELSVRLELQADCLAGVWGNQANTEGILEAGDLEEALNAAAKIGDDNLQQRSQGFVVPESFTHGTSEQRARWFKRGFDQGRIEACDTFSPSQV